MIWYTQVLFPQLVVFSFLLRNLLPISHVCTEDGEKPMVLLPFMAWGNLKQFLRQCKLAEANNPQVRLQLSRQTIIKSNIKPPPPLKVMFSAMPGSLRAHLSSFDRSNQLLRTTQATFVSNQMWDKIWRVMSGNECLVFSYDQAVFRQCVIALTLQLWKHKCASGSVFTGTFAIILI